MAKVVMQQLSETSERTMSKRCNLPDVRDGLTHGERIVQQQYGERQIPTSMLYGRVIEHVDMRVEDMKSILVRFVESRAI